MSLEYTTVYKSAVLEFLNELQGVTAPLALSEDLMPPIVKFNGSLKRILNADSKFNFSKHSMFYEKNVKGIGEARLIKKDETVFESPFIFIPSIDLSLVYSHLDESTRKCMWKHLQTIFFVSQKINHDDVNDISMPSEDHMRKMIDQIDTKMKPDDHERISSMMNDSSNPLVKLAQEITEDLMKGGMGGEEDFLKQLLSGKNGGIEGLMKKVQSKVDGKISTNDLDLSQMEASARNMMSSMEGLLPSSMMDLARSAGGRKGGA